MAADHTATFAEHIHELRMRLMWSLLVIAIGGGIGYALQDALLKILQQPLGETLYYTNPTGAFSFIVKLCIVFGFVVALPVLVYQAFGFLQPLMPKHTRHSFFRYVFMSVGLAMAGIAFAYFISLPAALHFLVNFGGGGNIQALITADEYFSFVLAYIAGFAALFQLPLIITFINKVTPLKPKQLLGGTRYVILGSFVISAVITPTPDPLNQALMAGPVILLFFLSVLVVGLVNHGLRRKQEQPMEDLSIPDAVLEPDDAPAPQPMPAPVAPVARPAVQPARTFQPRPQRLVTDMVVPAAARREPAYQPRSASRPEFIPQPAQRPMRIISDFIPASE
jgi:sec-independent protein translocase protein TatC